MKLLICAIVSACEKFSGENSFVYIPSLFHTVCVNDMGRMQFVSQTLQSVYLISQSLATVSAEDSVLDFLEDRGHTYSNV